MKRNEVIRRVREIVRWEETHMRLRRELEREPHNAALRFKVNDAWNALQAARKLMAEVDIRCLLRALTVHPVKDAEREAPVDRRGKRFTLEEVTEAIAAVNAGETIYSVAMRTGRRYNSMVQAVGRYRDGVSGLAKRAKVDGTWKESLSRGQA